MNTRVNLASDRIWVTGGGGFLGSQLLEDLRDRGAKNLISTRKSEVDLRSQEAVRKFFQKEKPDAVIHLAASVGGIGANELRPGDFFYDNMAMGLHIIHEASQSQVKRLVLLGTICAYPKFAPIPFREEEMWNGYPEETNAPYGVAKRSLVVMAESYRQQYGLQYSAVFPTNLYGPRDNFDLETSHVIPAMIRKCEEANASGARELELWGTGKPTRDFLYVKDASHGIRLALEKEAALGQVFNLGSEDEISIQDLAETIAKKTSFKGAFRWNSSRPDGQPRRCVSNERAKSVLGFVPQVSLEQGLQETVDWYRQTLKT